MTLSPFRLLSTRRQDGESGEEDGCGDNCKGRGEHEQCKSEEAADHQIEHVHLYSSHLHQVLSNPPDLVVCESLHVACHAWTVVLRSPKTTVGERLTMAVVEAKTPFASISRRAAGPW